MARIAILGAGMMGSALCMPLLDRGHELRLVGTVLDTEIITALKTGADHPSLRLPLPDAITPFQATELSDALRGIDAVALALVVGDKGFRADGNGVQEVEPRMLERAINQVDGVELRTVTRGHPLFGPACSLIRAEALVRIDCEPPLPCGLIVIGQRAALSLDARHGSELLMFLGHSLAAIIRRWLIDPKLS